MARLDAEGSGQNELQAMVQFAFLRRPLAELLQACAEASLELIVLKGAALAETLYPRPGLRPFGDIDVLVRFEDVSRAYVLLSALGYVTEDEAWADLVHGRSDEANFFRDTGQGPVVIELHTGLLNNPLLRHLFPLDTDGLWQRSQPAILANKEARVLGPEDQLLHLCLHLAGHYLAAPQSLRDINQLCLHAESGTIILDWALFLQLAHVANAETACFCSLYAAKHLLAAPIPEEVIDALSPGPQRRRMETLAAARAADLDQSQTEHLRFALLWHLMGSNRARLDAARHILFPAPRWLVSHYYYDLYDDPDPPHLSWNRQDNPLAAARNAARFFRTFLTLSLVHGGSLFKRALRLYTRRP